MTEADYGYELVIAGVQMPARPYPEPSRARSGMGKHTSRPVASPGLAAAQQAVAWKRRSRPRVPRRWLAVTGCAALVGGYRVPWRMVSRR